MMIDNYNNDELMAKYGRQCAKYKAIREAKEAIRDICMGFQNAEDAQSIENLKIAINEHINAYIEAVKLK